MSNLETTQKIYEAFGRGDVPAILSKISDSCLWEHWANNTAVSSGKVSYLISRRGKAGVGEFFASMTAVDLHDFQVLNLMAGGNQVAASVVIEFTVKATGKRLRDEEIHLWTFDKSGEVVGLRHYVDTAKHIAANS